MSELIALLTTMVAVLTAIPAAYSLITLKRDRAAAGAAERHAFQVFREELEKPPANGKSDPTTELNRDLLETFEKLSETKLSQLPDDLMERVQ